MSTTQRPTPETDAAIISADGAWTFELKETMQRLERERNEAREYAERCKQGCINLSFAIDRIDYVCGEPNEMEVSDYALHQDEKHVVERVKKQLEAMRGAIKNIYYLTEGYADGAPDASAHDKLCNEIADKLQPFLKTKGIIP